MSIADDPAPAAAAAPPAVEDDEDDGDAVADAELLRDRLVARTHELERSALELRWIRGGQSVLARGEQSRHKSGVRKAGRAHRHRVNNLVGHHT